MRIINPCVKCGACCASYRVSFYWSEADPNQGGTVPLEFTEALPPHRACMRGTNQAHPLCSALRGRVGDLVSCSIYNLRSSTCRDFGFHSENGSLIINAEDVERCDHARQGFGLPPLRLNTIIRDLHAQPRLRSHSHHHRAPMW